MITFTEEERSFISNQFTSLYQNANLRDYYNATLVGSILSKFKSISVTLTTQEIGLMQTYLTYQKEGLVHLTNQRAQHILLSQNTQGFGAPGASDNLKGSGLGAGGGAHTNFFDTAKQYKLCLSVIAKIMGP